MSEVRAMSVNDKKYETEDDVRALKKIREVLASPDRKARVLKKLKEDEKENAVAQDLLMKSVSSGLNKTFGKGK